MKAKKLQALFIPAIIVLIFDQVTKWFVRHNSNLQDLTLIEGVLEFNYVLNPGMALGIEWLPTQAISSIAIVATIGIIAYLLVNLDKANFGYLICMSFILGGSLGNISDRLFMGIIDGYGTVLEGHVVDFIHFSLRINDFAVFPYIFNVADIAISCSIITLIIFNRRLLPEEESKEIDKTDEVSSEATTDKSA